MNLDTLKLKDIILFLLVIVLTFRILNNKVNENFSNLNELDFMLTKIERSDKLKKISSLITNFKKNKEIVVNQIKFEGYPNVINKESFDNIFDRYKKVDADKLFVKRDGSLDLKRSYVYSQIDGLVNNNKERIFTGTTTFEGSISMKKMPQYKNPNKILDLEKELNDLEEKKKSSILEKKSANEIIKIGNEIIKVKQSIEEEKNKGPNYLENEKIEENKLKNQCKLEYKNYFTQNVQDLTDFKDEINIDVLDVPKISGYTSQIDGPSKYKAKKSSESSADSSQKKEPPINENGLRGLTSYLKKKDKDVSKISKQVQSNNILYIVIGIGILIFIIFLIFVIF